MHLRRFTKVNQYCDLTNARRQARVRIIGGYKYYFYKRFYKSQVAGI